MRLEVKNVPFNPMPVFNCSIANAARWTGNNAGCNRSADLYRRTVAPVPTGF